MSSPAPLHLVFGLVSASKEDGATTSFDAFAAWLLAKHDLEVERKAWPTYKSLGESVREGTSDIAWLPPVVYAWLAEGVNPLGFIARGGSSTYSAALVTLEESGLRTLADLRNARPRKRAGWVDPWSAAGYVVPRIELSRAGLDPAATFASETFYGSHREAMLALVRGDCDIAGTYARAPEEGRDPEGAWSDLEDAKVHVVAMFGSIPNDVLAARRNLAPTHYERVLEALRGASTDEGARPLLRAVFGGDEVREGIEAGHEALRTAFESATAKGVFD